MSSFIFIHQQVSKTGILSPFLLLRSIYLLFSSPLYQSLRHCVHSRPSHLFCSLFPFSSLLLFFSSLFLSLPSSLLHPLPSPASPFHSLFPSSSSSPSFTSSTSSSSSSPSFTSSTPSSRSSFLSSSPLSSPLLSSSPTAEACLCNCQKTPPNNNHYDNNPTCCLPSLSTFCVVVVSDWTGQQQQ
ncbi:hypothetical protein BKA57DRAFT_130542 [Linnemannia elongata]|nr:hypothetical protein BKA57DRAFT_130542 [Linnemannia elongata]